MKLKRYLLVAKPGIIFGNLIAVAGGYFLAARGSVDPMLLLATVIGLSLVVASGCVFNNCIDRDIDRLMERTRSRVTVTGQISLKAALAHGVVLGAAGFGLLAWKTNPLATLLAAFGFFVYVVLYSLWFKRRLGLRHTGRQPLRGHAAGGGLLRCQRPLRHGRGGAAADLLPLADAALLRHRHLPPQGLSTPPGSPCCRWRGASRRPRSRSCYYVLAFMAWRPCY